MLIPIIQLLAFIGLVLLLITLWSGNNDLIIITGLLGVFVWGLAAYGLFNVEFVGANGVRSSETGYVGVAYFALACALTCLWPALTGPIELVGESRDTDERFGRGGI